MQKTIKESIRRKFQIWLIILSIGPLLFFGGLLVWQNLMVQLQEIKELQNKLTQLVSNTISSNIHEQEAILLSSVRINNPINLDYNSQYQMLSKLLFSAADKKHINILNSLDLLDSKGNELVRLSRETFYPPTENRNLSRAEEFLIPAGKGEVYYSPVFVYERTGEPFMKIAIPIVDLRNLDLMGVLVAEIKMEFMINVLRDIRIGESGIAYILDRHGRLLAHPNPSMVLRGTYVAVPQQAAIIMGLQGQESLVDVNTIMFGNQQFNIVTELPLSEALRYTVRSLAAVLVFLLIALGGAVALELILARQIIRPIESLSRVSRAIREGDFSQQAKISGQDEIGVLAASFNSMTAKLVETIHSLEKQMAEIKEAEVQIIQQNEFMNNIMSSLTHPLHVIDVDNYTIKMANKAANFGSLSENSTCYSLTHHSDKPCGGTDHPCTIKEIKKTLLPVCLDHIHYDDQGKAKFFEVHGYPIFDKEGKVIQVIEYSLDVTTKKKLEGELRQSQKIEAIGTLAGGIAHDFNNILAAIIGYADMAREEVPETSEIREFIDQILTAGNRAKNMVAHILIFSRETEGERHPINIQPIVKETIKLLRATIPTTIEIRQRFQPLSGTILGDPTHIHQIVMNLCTNAYHAMEKTGGVLEIEMEEKFISANDIRENFNVAPGPYVVLKVSDTGTGIKPAVLERIFDPYFTTKEVDKGTGLGLSVTHGIVSSYGGMIDVESCEGKGSTFRVYFPMVNQEAVEPDFEQSAPQVKGNATILLVDDEPNIVKMATRMLERLGYKVIASTSSKEALNIFRSTPAEIDLVLTDQTMPELTGTELAIELLLIRPDLPIILSTGYSTQINEQSAKLVGIKEYIVKPYVIHDLAILIRSALRQECP